MSHFLSLKPRDFSRDFLSGITFILAFYMLDGFWPLFCFLLLWDLVFDFYCFFSSMLIKQNYFFIFLGKPYIIQGSWRASFGEILLLGSQTNIFYIKLMSLLYLPNSFFNFDWKVYIELFTWRNFENIGCFSIYFWSNFLYSSM